MDPTPAGSGAGSQRGRSCTPSPGRGEAGKALPYLAVSAPFVIKVLISSSWPYLAATWRGVLPYLSAQSISLPGTEKPRALPGSLWVQLAAAQAAPRPWPRLRDNNPGPLSTVQENCQPPSKLGAHQYPANGGRHVSRRAPGGMGSAGALCQARSLLHKYCPSGWTRQRERSLAAAALTWLEFRCPRGHARSRPPPAAQRHQQQPPAHRGNRVVTAELLKPPSKPAGGIPEAAQGQAAPRRGRRKEPLTVLDEDLRAREPSVDGGHVQRALPFLALQGADTTGVTTSPQAPAALPQLCPRPRAAPRSARPES